MKKSDLYTKIFEEYKKPVSANGFVEKQKQKIKNGISVLTAYLKNSMYTIEKNKLVIKNKDYFIKKIPLDGLCNSSNIIEKNLIVATKELSPNEMLIRAEYNFSHEQLFNITIPLAVDIYTKDNKLDTYQFYINRIPVNVT